jgi:ATP-dependent helicase/nuclease subunit A
MSPGGARGGGSVMSEKPSVREPNSEQKVAIQHDGGVLLSAGAGSGKTFVLVEHIVHLVKEFNSQNSDLVEDQYLQGLRKYLSSIVMMTFTNKAAGELALRLKERFEKQQKVEPEEERWKAATKALEYMTVGTIHGFCFKLLRQGFFPEISTEVNVISDAESGERIYELYESWFTQNEEGLRSNTPILYEIIVSHKSQILDVMKSIFNSPDLRLLWKNHEITKSLEVPLETHLGELLETIELKKALTEPIDIYHYNKEEKTKWFGYLDAWTKLLSSIEKYDESFLKNLDVFFKEFKGIRAPSQDKYPEVHQYMQEMKELRSFVDSYGESLVEYESHRETTLKDFQQTVRDIYNFIEDNYKMYPGLTFSDLEYFVLKGLESSEVCKRVRETYHYFIIDEFQDTSEVQFDIVNKILEGDLTKLFCVGDLKQAIYGFRGGELGVFKSCMEKIPQTLTMKNNYRSFKNVIDFNNHLFEDIFKKGFGYEGIDEGAVHVDFQEFPEGTGHGQGDLFKVHVEVQEGETSIKGGNQSHLDYAESLEFLEQIKKLRSEFPEDRVCILYRNLKPSTYLISHMIEENVGFTAQVKIPGGEDPLMGMFNLLLKTVKIQNDDKSSTAILKILNSYLKHLKIKDIEITQNKIDKFKKDSVALGLNSAFESFVFDSGFSNSNYSNNMSFIATISSLAGDNPDTALSLLEQYLGDKYSLDFCFGENSGNVIIMTVHASKGLEFEHVVLGGLHSNGRWGGMDGYFGKIPGSFKWKKDSNQKKPYTTPQYIKEYHLEKKKDFSESKRLFYVAGTRAVKSLTWVDLNGLKGSGKKKAMGPLSYGGNGWIDGIRSFEYACRKESEDVYKEIKSKTEKKEMIWNISEDKLSTLSNIPPLFQRDSVGLYPRQRVEETPSLGFVSELSVTRLASLAQCPRKFYLGNILKFTPDEVDSWFEEVQLKSSEEFTTLESENSESSFLARGRNSAERGTRIHESMAHIVEHNFVMPRVLEDETDRKCLEYGTQLLKEIPAAEFIPEKLIKFPIFNFTISGTPDLMIKVGGDVIEIWDYKTGRRKEESEKSYWFQLKTYANACYQLGLTSQSKEIKLSLIYLDEENRVDEKVDYNTLNDWLFEYWKKLSDVEQKVESHCPSCSFGKLCLT